MPLGDIITAATIRPAVPPEFSHLVEHSTQSIAEPGRAKCPLSRRKNSPAAAHRDIARPIVRLRESSLGRRRNFDTHTTESGSRSGNNFGRDKRRPFRRPGAIRIRIEDPQRDTCAAPPRALVVIGPSGPRLLRALIKKRVVLYKSGAGAGEESSKYLYNPGRRAERAGREERARSGIIDTCPQRERDEVISCNYTGRPLVRRRRSYSGKAPPRAQKADTTPPDSFSEFRRFLEKAAGKFASPRSAMQLVLYFRADRVVLRAGNRGLGRLRGGHGIGIGILKNGKFGAARLSAGPGLARNCIRDRCGASFALGKNNLAIVKCCARLFF